VEVPQVKLSSFQHAILTTLKGREDCHHKINGHHEQISIEEQQLSLCMRHNMCTGSYTHHIPCRVSYTVSACYHSVPQGGGQVILELMICHLKIMLYLQVL